MVYERVTRPVTEEDATNQIVPFTNYGMQKLFGEYMVRGENKEFGVKYLIIRPFNAVGSGELPEVRKDGEVEFGMAHLIPDFVYKAMIKQSPFQIFGDGKQVRTFTHAKDIAEAIVEMLKRGIINDDFNLFGNNTFEIGELA
jgi:UDP-glucose 4-epimerase